MPETAAGGCEALPAVIVGAAGLTCPPSVESVLRPRAAEKARLVLPERLGPATCSKGRFLDLSFPHNVAAIPFLFKNPGPIEEFTSTE